MWLQTNSFISESHRVLGSNVNLLGIQLIRDLHAGLNVCIAYKLSNGGNLFVY